MHYIYHGVPDNMIGTALVPLNRMEGEMATVKQQHLRKYDGREDILARRIPLLDCLWNDVIQFLPFHPQKVFELQRDLGLIPEIPPYRFYEIPLHALDPGQTVIFFKTAPGEENTDVKWLTDVDYADLDQVPQATVNYYETLVGTGELPFNYQFIPHVLYKGELDISESKTITLEAGNP